MNIEFMCSVIPGAGYFWQNKISIFAFNNLFTDVLEVP